MVDLQTEVKIEKNRLRRLSKAAGTRIVTTTKQCGLVLKELATAPLRCVKHMGANWIDDVLAWNQTVAPTTLVGIPATALVLATGATTLIAPGALVGRCANGAQTTLGKIFAGTAGFLIGTALLIWVWELAMLYAVFETMCYIASAAQAALSDEQLTLAHAT